MMTPAIAMLATAFSTLCMARLRAGDPKRLRTAGLGHGAMPGRQRRLLAAGACAPGLGCALAGDAVAFLLWLGATALAGWLLALRADPVGGQGRGAVSKRPRPQ